MYHKINGVRYGEDKKKTIWMFWNSSGFTHVNHTTVTLPDNCIIIEYVNFKIFILF